MGIFNNEFFACPSYAYGGFVLSVIVYILYVVMGKSYFDPANPDITPAMKVVGLAGLGWMLWSLAKFASRNPNCKRVGYPHGAFRNPVSSLGPNPVV